jgi:hypothetical protein
MMSITRAILAGAVTLLIVASCYESCQIASFLKREMRSLEDHRDHVLHHANHALIVEEAREMIRNTELYRLRGGDLLPANLPPYIQSLEPYNVLVLPQEGVFIRFGRLFTLYVAAEENPQKSAENPEATEIHPGLWYADTP